MSNIDIEYVTNTMCGLSGIPIRIYKKQKLVHYQSIVYLPKDPVVLWLDKLFSITDHIGYYVTPFFDYYSIVNSKDISIIFGPTRLLPANEQDYKKIAFQLGLTKDEINDFVTGMKSIVNMPLDSILQMMCVLNYMLNGEKKTIKELAIIDCSQKLIKEELETKKTNVIFENIDSPRDNRIHNTFSIEEMLVDIISGGNTEELKKWTQNAPAVRGGTLAFDDIRQLKNIFIVSTTLASRAAIRGGLSAEDALQLSDAYIQRCEMLQTHSDVSNLQYRMILDYTEKVEKIKRANLNSKLALDVLNYVQHHLSEPVNTQKIANELYMSRSGLSTKFKTETGKKLTEFIMETKLQEAKNLLKYTDKTIITISEYLGFSSQSHFNHAFLQYENMTPKDYRKQNKSK